MTAPLCLFGASPFTGNQGVTALCFATLGALHDRGLRDVTVFDHGVADSTTRIGRNGTQIRFERAGARCGRRVWSADHLLRIDLATRLGSNRNRGARLVRNAAAVLDLSAGDSFTDLYGTARFEATLAPKRIAVRAGRPLILLPQTYGPFRSSASEAAARRILERADQAWARDADSHARLAALLGDAFDPARHRLGVDMAFGLWGEPLELPAATNAWIEDDAGRRARPVVGINVSGLLFNDPAAAARFGLRCDYRTLVESLVAALVHETDARVLLIPHVHAPLDEVESDLAAARRVAGPWATHADRVAVLEGRPDARQLKWLIARLDWFCGARMHATIAALSSCVPVAGLAYSLKAKGVFERCGAGSSLFDLRGPATSTLVTDLMAHYQQRDGHRTDLASAMPKLRAAVDDQADRIVAAIAAAPSAGARAA